MGIAKVLTSNYTFNFKRLKQMFWLSFHLEKTRCCQISFSFVTKINQDKF